MNKPRFLNKRTLKTSNIPPAWLTPSVWASCFPPAFRALEIILVNLQWLTSSKETNPNTTLQCLCPCYIAFKIWYQVFLPFSRRGWELKPLCFPFKWMMQLYCYWPFLSGYLHNYLQTCFSSLVWLSSWTKFGCLFVKYRMYNWNFLELCENVVIQYVLSYIWLLSLRIISLDLSICILIGLFIAE